MKNKLKGLLIGLLVGVIFGASLTSAFAASTAIQKTLHYNNIKITVDSKEVKPTDANGNYVEPFIIDGTTYLSVRAIANALGLDVAWDGNTNTAKLSTKAQGATTGNNSTQTNALTHEKAFDIAKEYLINNGYKQVILTDNVSYQYEKYLSNATVAVIYKEKTNTILMRYEPDYVEGYDIANVIIEISRSSNDARFSVILYPKNVITSYSPEISLSRDAFSQDMFVKFNDQSIPQHIRQSVDEYACKNAVRLLNAANEVLSGSSITLRDLGFVNF